MTRKDYKLIAKAINSLDLNTQDEELRAHVAKHLADALESDNPRFDRYKFLEAAGVGEVVYWLTDRDK